MAPGDEFCTVVIPCYNEAVRLQTDVYESFLRSQENDALRLLFVNDGSSDGTLLILERMRDRFPGRVEVLNQERNRGKAEAVRRGMLHVMAQRRASVTGFWDADLATPLEQIRDLLQLLHGHSELNLVFGARVRLLGREIHRQPLRHYLGRCFATVVSMLLRMPVYDTQCGAKLFRITPELERVLTRPFHSRWIFDVEILARFLEVHNGNVGELERQIYEYPLPVWRDVAGSKVHAMDFLRAFGELAVIFRRQRAR